MTAASARASSSTSGRKRRPRGSLSRDEILEAAYPLVEHDGLAALSMPALSRAVGAGVTSIYWYFRNKDELLVALAERVTADVYQRWSPMGDGPWDKELRRSYASFRSELNRVPVYLELFQFRPIFVLVQPKILPITMRRLESDIAKLHGAGLSPTAAALAHNVCSVYVRGFVTLERGIQHESEEHDESVHAGIIETMEHLDPRAFPALTELGDVDPTTALDDDTFAHGLDLLIEGIRSMIDSRDA